MKCRRKKSLNSLAYLMAMLLSVLYIFLNLTYFVHKMQKGSVIQNTRLLDREEDGRPIYSDGESGTT